jgi:hypothetical protein
MMRLEARGSAGSRDARSFDSVDIGATGVHPPRESALIAEGSYNHE